MKNMKTVNAPINQPEILKTVKKLLVESISAIVNYFVNLGDIFQIIIYR